MEQDNSTIHDFDFDLICEFFSTIPRQGPGSPETTRNALRFIDHLNERSTICDLGCGTGGQTMVMAQNAPGQITGIDLFPRFINQFNENAKQLNLDHRVKGMVGSMDNLPFEDESIDLIWSEGAIYNIGFERGINEWRRFLKTGGYIAVSEASWFTKTRPEEVFTYWNDAYPEIDLISTKVKQMEEAGYVPISTFIIPEECWTTHFYVPQEEALNRFLEKHRGNKSAEELVRYLQSESEMYSKYKEFYGYAFYIGRKR